MKRGQQSECGGCGSEERWFLHNVRHRGTYRRLCSSCVLKNHQGLFCPICLDVFEEVLPTHVRLMCLKCPSISHLSCVPDNSATNFTCPPCSNPNFTFFRINNNNNKRLKSNDNDGEDAVVLAEHNNSFIDRDSAKALVAAAKISAASMTKAATVARVEAEKRVKEAALAKKRAKEALERLVYLAAKEKEKDSKFKGSVQVAEQKLKSRIGSDGINKNGVTVEGNGKQSKGSNGLYSGKLQTGRANVG